MASKEEHLKWEEYIEKYHRLLDYGLCNGLVKSYDEETIKKFRSVYYAGLPASVILLCSRMCQGYCYDRALLLAAAFDCEDFKIIDADIDGLSLCPLYIDQHRIDKSNRWANHCWVERILPDGSTWVYDTSLGLVIEKELYYKIQNPRITKVSDKKTIQAFSEYSDIIKSNLENDKYALPYIIPNIESAIEFGDEFYQDVLFAELERFKVLVNYDEICKELNEDMELRGFGSSGYKFGG